MYAINNTKQVWDLTLLQILSMGDSINSYALALGKSRNEHMTPHLAAQLGRAAQRDDKWLQVARRVIEKDYAAGFQYCIQDENLLQPLIIVYFTQPKSSPLYQNHSLIIYNKALSILKLPANQLPIHLTQMKNFQLYLELTLKHNETNILRQLFNVFSNYPCEINNMLSPIWTLDGMNNNLGLQQCWGFHECAIKIFRDLVGVVGAMEAVAVRKMWVHQFESSLNDRSKGCTIRQIIEYKIMGVAQLLSTKAKAKTIPNFQHVKPSVLKLAQTQKPVKLVDYYTDLCATITAICSISALQCSLGRNQPLLWLITEVVRSIDILSLNNHSNIEAQTLAINDEINSHLYSDTLAGTFMRMVTVMCKNIGPFFNLYFQMLREVYTQESMSGLRSQQFIGYLLKVELLSEEKLLESRKQQVGKLLEIVNSVVAPNWNSYGQWEQLQVLRYFLVFTGSIKSKEASMSESAEDLILKCVTLCFSCLKSQDRRDPPQEDQLSPIQLQCRNILETLPEQPKTLHLVKKSLLPTILTQFIQFPNPPPAILELFHAYITKVPQIISRSSEYIIDYLHSIFLIEASFLQRNSNQGFRIKSTQRIVKVLGILCTVLENESELREEDIEQRIVRPILMKLCEPNLIDYEQELLSLLELVLRKHCHLSPDICYIISKLPQVYQKNDKKLSILANIYRALALPKHIRDQIVYEYSDIISIMLQMFVDYVQHALSVQQFMYYRDEVRGLLWNIQLFINKFADAIIENNLLVQMVGATLFNGLCICLQNTIKYIDQYNQSHQYHLASNASIYYQFQQLQTQLFFTITHLLITPQAHPFNQTITPNTVKLIQASSPTNFIYFQTIRMVPVILIDQLFIDPDHHEQIIGDLVGFCEAMGKKEMEWGMRKEWGKIQGVEEWDLWPVKVKEYVENVLREMRNRKAIDQVDHAQYTEAIAHVLR